TYFEQRSFLLDRADEQARAAVPVVGRALGGEREPPHGPRRGDGGGGPPPEVTLPFGTYAQRRDAGGKAQRTIVYGAQSLPAPSWPKQIGLGRAVSVGSSGGSGLRYRVLAAPAHDAPGADLVAIPLRDVDSTLDRLLVVEGLVIAGVVLALAALAWWLVRLGLRPLDRMGATAGRIAAGDLSQRVAPATERTEVGRLGLALNGMLTQIERAFAEREASESRLRRFLADASHELRTPLASIRGYAELYRMGAASEPAEAARAMGRIEDESKRMGALVENLLTLARLDQLPEPIREPVDLTRLVRDAGADARASAPDRNVAVSVEAPLTVLGDPSQLRQVIANLVANVLAHTPAGTPVELTADDEAGQAILRVRDYGPGLPDGDTDALFERFWRADPGRERGAAGAGLGLSIVAAIVAAHGGSVHAANAPGGGAEFTVRLPLSR
ncbi:MAG: two-component system, OmpR family, sensor kinase, partial [Thermoleophilaceae bacterium]|nr:two-component system, OmpR family, sensor kinase [Thermoleophilaceae bacterium]